MMDNPIARLTGSYAFPMELLGTRGITVLDYFASKAMAGLVARREEPGKISQMAYDLAENMIAERKKRMDAIEKVDRDRRTEAGKYH
jgi:hypothetical protein